MLITDSKGKEVTRINYTPFGEVHDSSTGLDSTTYKFTGQELDEETALFNDQGEMISTGLMYYNARYYDPVLGRFLSPDKIVPNWTNPADLNRYSYVRNNPLIYIDPSGHKPFISTGWSVTGFFATAGGGGGVNVTLTGGEDSFFGKDTKITVTASGNVMAGGGFFLGGGPTFSFGDTGDDPLDTDPSSDYFDFFDDANVTIHIEGNLGWGKTIGGSVDYDLSNGSKSASIPFPKARAGVGAGIHLGVGPALNIDVLTIQIGRILDDIFGSNDNEKIIDQNSPPDTDSNTEDSDEWWPW